MSQVPFIIEGTSFPEIIVLANPEYKQVNSQRINTPLDSFLALQEIKDSPNRYSGELRVKLDTEKHPQSPYHIEIVCLVILSLSDDIPEQLRHDWATRAAHSIAFPAVRELVLTLTSRQPWGQFNIGLSSLTQKPTKPAAKKKPAKRADKPVTGATISDNPKPKLKPSIKAKAKA